MSTTPFSLFAGFVFLHAAAFAAPATPDARRADLYQPAVYTRVISPPAAAPVQVIPPAIHTIPSNARVNPVAAPQHAGSSVRWALYYRKGSTRPPIVVSGDARSRFNWY